MHILQPAKKKRAINGDSWRYLFFIASFVNRSLSNTNTLKTIGHCQVIAAINSQHTAQCNSIYANANIRALLALSENRSPAWKNM